MKFKNGVGNGMVGLFACTLLASSGATAKPAQNKTLEKAPITQSQPYSGKEMYKDYCAACHGLDGKGNGPAAEFLKAPPPDLTTMATRSKGKSVSARTEAVLRMGTGNKAHGTLDMPVWGELFKSLDKTGDHEITALRIANLSKYVESIQTK